MKRIIHRELLKIFSNFARSELATAQGRIIHTGAGKKSITERMTSGHLSGNIAITGLSRSLKKTIRPKNPNKAIR
jgi:hypothetical protein